MVPDWNQFHHLVGRGRRTQVQVHLDSISRSFLKIKIASVRNNKHFPYQNYLNNEHPHIENLHGRRHYKPYRDYSSFIGALHRFCAKTVSLYVSKGLGICRLVFRGVLEPMPYECGGMTFRTLLFMDRLSCKCCMVPDVLEANNLLEMIRKRTLVLNWKKACN